VLARNAPFGPTPGAERIAGIDFVRGVALLGILLVNSALFFGPMGLLFDPGLLGSIPAVDRTAYAVVVGVCQGKFIALFSLLFGYGLLGQIEKAAAAGRSPALFTFRRLGTLAVFGFLHAVFLWYGDVLLIYACLGGWLLLVRGAAARTLLTAAVLLLLVSVLLRGGLECLGALVKGASAPEASVEADGPRGMEAMGKALMDPSHAVWLRAEVRAYRDGPWLEAQTFRVVECAYNWVLTPLYGGWQVFGMFLLGGALWRVRFFAPQQSTLRWRVLLWCLPAGACLEAVAAWLYWGPGLTSRYAWAAGSAVQGVSVCVLPAGYLAGLALLADRLPGWLRAPVVSAGRMALTVYLLETLVCTFLAYHWGLGWFGRLGVLQEVLLALAVWGALVLFSWGYLLVFPRGPMEVLWRRLEYGRSPRPREV
jgi:uncharacterized protein